MIEFVNILICLINTISMKTTQSNLQDKIREFYKLPLDFDLKPKMSFYDKVGINQNQHRRSGVCFGCVGKKRGRRKAFIEALMGKIGELFEDEDYEDFTHSGFVIHHRSI
jgi:hypothetical protein